MATLSTTEKALVQAQIDYMLGEFEKPIDDVVAQRLSTLHAKFGFTSQIAYLEGLRDAPFSTLLKSLLAVSA